jgi:4-amino-4-deoxy-L-arabinose transferase-like glycosyltransferase
LLLPAAVFLTTVQGRIQYWDTGEMQTVPWIFGIAHPTGFPAYTIIAGIFVHVFAIGTPAWRASFFCAVLALGSIAIVYATIVRITGDRWTAIATAWLLAFGWYFWIFGDRAEIHVMESFCSALALYFALRGYYEGDVRAFYAAAGALGLGLATHPLVMFVIPSVALLAVARRAALPRRTAAIMIGLLVLPLISYAYLPLRSHTIVAQGLDPSTQLGKPAGAAIWNMNDPRTFPGFMREVTGSEFHAARSVLSIIDPLLYGRRAGLFGSAMYKEFTPAGAAIACICLGILFRRRAVVALALLAAVLLPAAFALAYPEVVEPQRYFFTPIVATAMIVGLGITALPPYFRNMLRLPVAAAALFLLAANYPEAQLRSAFGAEDLVAHVRADTPADAIVIADWTRGTALAYAAYVDGDMQRRSIDIAWPYQEMRYLPQWLATRPVYYIGRLVPLSSPLVLCPVAKDLPIYSVHLEPRRC